MGMMSIEHPDILSFIRAKDQPGEFENFNLSVKVTDAFMSRLNSDPDSLHVVRNPRTGVEYVIPKTVAASGYELKDLLPAGPVDLPCYSVRDVWLLIVDRAHATGEPGICFIDRVNADNPTPQLGRIEATNPCGEQPLLHYESCNLGSINLSAFVISDGRDIEWDRLAETVDLGVRFLDDVIDVNCYPVPEIAETTLGNRKIGLGVMGFADTLILLGIRYDSREAVTFAGKVMAFIQERAHQASEELARQRGAFPNWEGSIWDTVHHRKVRNATCTTIAPTGSISIIARCSSGIEPIFSLAVKRRALDGQEFVEFHPLLEQMGEQQGWLDEPVKAALLEGRHPTEIPGFPKQLAGLFVTAHEVAPEWHVRVQAAFQEYVDNAVSKTVNLPNDATLEDVDKVFRLAYKLGCKGITVYRDSSRQGQTLSAPGGASHSTAGTDKADATTAPAPRTPRPRGRVTVGRTVKSKMGCGTLFTTVNRDKYGLCEVFAALGKAGGCPSQSEATCRAVSVALRSGVDPAVLIEQLKGIRCMSTCLARKDNGEISVLSCPDAIARAIEEAIAEGLERSPDVTAPPAGRPCPHCGLPMRRESGCSVCDQCQYNSCG